MKLRQTLSIAVLHLLRPLVRVLLRHGMAYDEFSELARRAYVDVAERDFAITGRKQTGSRISVITGLNRKEVARLQALNSTGDPAEAVFAHAMNRAAKVAAGWLHEHRAADGTPAPLDAEGFAQLVRRHSGDMPARAVLDELRVSGAVHGDEGGLLHLAPQGYVPQATDERKITLLGQHAADLLGAIDHNLSHPPEQAYLQQRVFAEHIPADRIEQLRAALRATGQQALTDARELLVDNDAGDAALKPGARRVTLGVYYFEDDAAPPSAGADASRAADLADRPATAGTRKPKRRRPSPARNHDTGEEP
ncbi:MAG: DUF6502 family protein [Rhizobacter sp.]|nr:DUF6502 family protein [Rhizobacter sp.]